jgi:hypothetical protein
MSFSNLSDLKTAIASWLARSGDTAITGNAGDFVTLAEAYLNRNLRVRQMEVKTTLTFNGGERNLPDDYLAWRRLTWIGDINVDLNYMVPSAFERRYPVTFAGIPSSFTIEGNTIKVRPTDDDSSFEFLYFAAISPLVDNDDSNWLLERHPDLYLAASLTEAQAFLINPDHAALWAQKRDELMGQLVNLSEKTKAGAIVQTGAAVY